MIKKEFISDWTKEKIGLPADAPLTRETLEAYQVKKLRETVAMAKKNSTFYGRLFASVDPERDIMSTKDMQKLPFTSPADLLAEEEGLLCVRPGEISRIVTLETSGTQGKPKRVYFTKEDQELTTAYFWIGLHNMADDTDRALILLPCRRPGSSFCQLPTSKTTKNAAADASSRTISTDRTIRIRFFLLPMCAASLRFLLR